MRVETIAARGDKHGESEEDEAERSREKDIFLTAVRRKYIPPLMETFQDILVQSVYHFEASASEADKMRLSKEFLK